MKALSLWQPWASLWVLGPKVHETRHWELHHRGPLAVHAALKKPSSLGLDAGFTRLVREQLHVGALDDLPRGGIVGVVDITGCISTNVYTPASALDEAFGDWSHDRYAIAAIRPSPIDLIPLRGHQGLWDLEDDVVAEVARRLAGAAA